MIVDIEIDDVIATARSSLGMPAGHDADDAYWLATFRRLAGQHCPCSPRTLINAVLESHRWVVSGSVEELDDRLEMLLDQLVSAGDLLELNDVATLDEAVKGTWLFASPPSFVIHPTSNHAYLIGLSTDDPMPIPGDVRRRIISDGAVRRIPPGEGEDLTGLLKGVGLRQLAFDTWMRAPKVEAAKDLVTRLNGFLDGQPRVGEIQDLKILDWTIPTRSYRKRWAPPRSQTGSFVVRRPQAYGADLWGYARLNDGRVEALIDLPLPQTRWRGCDGAWRLQLAIDETIGQPQRYRLAQTQSGKRADFFFPLPEWARRRLAVVGREVSADQCLISFEIAEPAWAGEAQFLREYLFFECDEQNGVHRP